MKFKELCDRLGASATKLGNFAKSLFGQTPSADDELSPDGIEALEKVWGIFIVEGDFTKALQKYRSGDKSQPSQGTRQESGTLAVRQQSIAQQAIQMADADSRLFAQVYMARLQENQKVLVSALGGFDEFVEGYPQELPMIAASGFSLPSRQLLAAHDIHAA